MRYLVVVGLVGCASPSSPPFLGVSVESERTVYFGASMMDFGGTSILMPTRLDIDRAAVLEEPTTCGPLTRIGTALYPAVSAVGEAPDGRTTEFEIVWRGPVAARIRTGYEMPYECGGVMTKLTGTTTFTFFGNDRVIRVDENQIASTASQSLPASSACGCTTTAAYAHMSYWAFSSGQVHDKNFVIGPVQDAPACIAIDTVMIGMKYFGTSVFANNDAGHPIVEQTFGGTDGSNWPGGGAPAKTTSELAAVPRGDDEAMACAQAIEHIEGYPPIVLNGGDEIVPEDGIYHATKRYHETVTITTNMRSIPSSFVLEIDLDGAKHVRVTDDFGDKPTYNVQQLPDGHLLFDLPPISSVSTSRISLEPQY